MNLCDISNQWNEDKNNSYDHLKMCLTKSITLLKTTNRIFLTHKLILFVTNTNIATLDNANHQ